LRRLPGLLDSADQQPQGDLERRFPRQARRSAGTARGHWTQPALREEAAGERLRALEEELREARQARRDAEAAEGKAGATVKAADRKLRDARRSAERAARDLERLEKDGQK
jgi:hypothetical protein